MLNRLEVACSQAIEKQFQIDAALAAERGALISFAERTQMIASTSALTREAAMEALCPTNARQPVYEGAFNHRGLEHTVCTRTCGRFLKQ